MDRKIKIITQDFFPIEGGITTWVHHLALELQRLGASVEVITRYWHGRTYDDSIFPYEVVRLNDGRWKSRKYQRIYNYISSVAERDEKFSAICANWKMAVPMWWYNSLRTKKEKIPYIIMVHGLDAFESRMFNRWMMRRVLNGADFVVSGAKNVAQIIRREHRYSPEIPIIHCGVDVNIFKPMSIEAEFFEKYKIPRDRKIVLSLGRLVPRKGFDNVIRALPIIEKQVSNFMHIIAGRGKYEKYLKNLAEEIGVSDRVKFVGFVPDEDVPKFFNIADVFAMPSREIGTDIEGFGITYLEANACGKPVVAGNSGGVPDAVEDGVNGLLVPPEDVKKIADAITKFLVDENFARKIGKKGFERVHSNFLWSMTAEKFFKLLNQDNRG
ncbi:glycosyltransferase family 4 protein [bacterium]|nr:glycosyltransferase family 4 protein [bacterium]